MNTSAKRTTLGSTLAVLASLRTRKGKALDHTNRAGASSCQRSLREQVVSVLTTGTLSDTFYVSRDELAKEAVEVLTQCREADPSFLAKALVYAREVGMMKLLPTLGLVILSAGGGRTKKHFESVFDRVIRTPDDLRSFVEICSAGAIRGRKGLGGMTVPLVREWLCGMSEYHALKYGSAVSKGVTLRDIVRMSHPRPRNQKTSEMFDWLVRGRLGCGSSNTKLNPKLRALEALKQATSEDEQVRLIREGALPYEVVVPSLRATSARIWTELLYQAPYQNLLRMLATFTRQKVFEDEANVRFACEKLANPAAIEHSKVLPFRFYNAWNAYLETEDHHMAIADALRQACETSFQNMPSFGNRTVVIAPDTSGSMNGRVSDKGTTRFIDIAGLFTGALLKRCEDRVLVLPFDTSVHTNHSLSARDDILVTAKKVASYGGGGTAVGAPVQYLLNRKMKVDVVIGITDNEDWVYGRGSYASDSFYSLWLRYKKEVNPDAIAYLVTIAPYRDAVAPTGAKGVHFIYGWSDKVLQYIGATLEGGESQIQAVEQIALDTVGTTATFV
jgi:60 kDa SS-A/Ro ribonucleoprotein